MLDGSLYYLVKALNNFHSLWTVIQSELDCVPIVFQNCIVSLLQSENDRLSLLFTGEIGFLLYVANFLKKKKNESYFEFVLIQMFHYHFHPVIAFIHLFIFNYNKT